MDSSKRYNSMYFINETESNRTMSYLNIVLSIPGLNPLAANPMKILAVLTAPSVPPFAIHGITVIIPYVLLP